jgi:hypothetical protein
LNSNLAFSNFFLSFCSNQEGQAEISKQTMRLFHTQSDTPSRKNSQKQSFHSDHQTKVSVTCSAQHKAGSVGSDKENCQLEPGTTKSPLQSPDSNTHPIDISPISTASNANVGGPLELDQVAIIDSQYSPSKHTNEEENATANPLSVTSPTLSPAIANIKLNATQEKAPSRKQTSHSNHSSSKAPKAILNVSKLLIKHQMRNFFMKKGLFYCDKKIIIFYFLESNYQKLKVLSEDHNGFFNSLKN